MPKPRAYTEEEVTKKYLDHFRMLARYWAELPDMTPLKRCEGAVFSMLSTMDGCSALPMLMLSVNPHPDDKEYMKAHGMNWFEEGMSLDSSLHEQFYEKPDE